MTDAAESTINVVVRCRPLLEHEKSDSSIAHCINFDIPTKTLSVRYDALDAKSGGAASDSLGWRAKQYQFHEVFDDTSDNQKVFESSVLPLLDHVVNGYDATFFAYGQVGSGKTHTISGIAPLVGRRLLSFANSRNKQSTPHSPLTIGLRAAYFELYNEQIFDLMASPTTMDTKNVGLSSNGSSALRDVGQASGHRIRARHSGQKSRCSANAKQPQLRIREHPEAGVFVENLSTCAVASEDDYSRIVDLGTARRSTANHLMNARSSRSHAILMLLLVDTSRIKRDCWEDDDLENENTLEDQKQFVTKPLTMQVVMQKLHVYSQLNLVDLAGSERAGRTGTVSNTSVDLCVAPCHWNVTLEFICAC